MAKYRYRTRQEAEDTAEVLGYQNDVLTQLLRMSLFKKSPAKIRVKPWTLFVANMHRAHGGLVSLYLDDPDDLPESQAAGYLQPMLAWIWKRAEDLMLANQPADSEALSRVADTLLELSRRVRDGQTQ